MTFEVHVQHQGKQQHQIQLDAPNWFLALQKSIQQLKLEVLMSQLDISLSKDGTTATIESSDKAYRFSIQPLQQASSTSLTNSGGFRIPKSLTHKDDQAAPSVLMELPHDTGSYPTHAPKNSITPAERGFLQSAAQRLQQQRETFHLTNETTAGQVAPLHSSKKEKIVTTNEFFSEVSAKVYDLQGYFDRNLRGAMQYLLDLVLTGIPADGGGILLFHPEKEEKPARFVFAIGEQKEALQKLPYDKHLGLVGFCLKHQSAFTTEYPFSQPRFHEDPLRQVTENPESIVLAPIQSEFQIYGFFLFYRKKERGYASFTHGEKGVLSYLAETLGNQLANASLKQLADTWKA